MTSFTFDDRGALLKLSADLQQSGFRAGARAASVTRKYGIILQGRVKANAAGRPGPRIQTGDYSRSISVRFGSERGSPVASVGTNRPQGPRLEFGFIGADSLGRTYAQQPLTHFGPAFEKTAPEYEAALAIETLGIGMDR